MGILSAHSIGHSQYALITMNSPRNSVNPFIWYSYSPHVPHPPHLYRVLRLQLAVPCVVSCNNPSYAEHAALQLHCFITETRPRSRARQTLTPTNRFPSYRGILQPHASCQCVTQTLSSATGYKIFGH